MYKIGFDAKRLFNNFTGLGNYSRSLVEGLKTYYPNDELYLFTPKTKNKPDTQPFFSNKYNIVTPSKGSKNIWRTFKCIKDITGNQLDIYHGLSHELPVGINKTKTKSVVTIHDLIYKTYPNDFSAIDRKIYDFKFKYACKNADAIVAISESTKRDLINLYNLNPDKIHVGYQTCHDMFKQPISEEKLKQISSDYKLPPNFMLYVGSIIERKNLLGIIKAMETLPTDITIPLVVVGNGNKYLNKVKSYIANKNISNQIIFLSNLKYNHLPAIYQLAELFLYPSQYEGFGIPLIESLYCKTPVITSDLSSLPEAAGPGAYYCNPTDHLSIKAGIEKILTDKNYKQELIDQGYSYVQKFNSEETTKNIYKIYKSLID